MKRKTLANAIMVAAIVLIAASCVLFVSLMKGESRDPLADAYLAEHLESSRESGDGTEKAPPERTETAPDEETQSDGAKETETETEAAEALPAAEVTEETAPGETKAAPESTENAAPPSTSREPEPRETKAPATTTSVETETESAEERLFCTVTIRCDTVLSNEDSLDWAKAPYVPADGCILPATEVEIEEGESVFGVLRRVCEENGVQIEYSWTPVYDSYYIEGIGHLYEFDCGEESGWMYRVNGEFARYGSSSYKLSGGERIEWLYTCRGLGADVGAPEW